MFSVNSAFWTVLLASSQFPGCQAPTILDKDLETLSKVENPSGSVSVAVLSIYLQ